MRKIVALLPLLFLFSCMKSSVYSEMFRDFDNNRWAMSDIRTFDIDIIEDTNASIVINFSHVYEPGFTNVPVVLTIKKPSGEEELLAANMLLKDKTGNDISDCTGDICDLEFTLTENYSFTKGKYKITVANAVNAPFLPNVLGLGLEIRTPEK